MPKNNDNNVKKVKSGDRPAKKTYKKKKAGGKKSKSESSDGIVDDGDLYRLGPTDLA